jgi:hypothetical protein
MEAEVAAYAQVTSAEAEKDAAERRAAARLTQAKADQEAKALEAEGQKAVELVPVQVAREQVSVEAARTEVERQRLENQAAHETIARGLQVDLARIEAEKEIRVAAAQAMGVALSAAKITVWGDPGAVERITRSFMAGQQMANGIEGFLQGAPDGLVQSVSDLTEAVIRVLDQRGIPVPRETVREVIAEATRGQGKGSDGTASNGKP